jgi:hypothetical protein
MKRIALGLALCVGMLFTAVMPVSAARYCNLDPTVGIGLPIHTHLDVSLSLLGASAHVYVSNTSHSTTFGGVLGLP